MVFRSQNKDRKCKWCKNPQKERIIETKKGKPRKKGYHRTCGSEKCLKASYNDRYICILKGRLKNPIDHECDICGKDFIPVQSNHTRFCKECVPDKSWRARSARYGIGKPQWMEILKNQKGSCALCNRNPEVVDHCHTDGTVRGILCNKCNVNIKFLDMETEFKKKAIEYTGVKDVSFCE